MIRIQVGNVTRNVDLSQKQYEVLREMYTTNALLVTSEGSYYKSWLQVGVVKSDTRVSVTTANCLYKGGWIVLCKEPISLYRVLYYYELTPKAKKLFVL